MDYWQENREQIERLLLDETPEILLLVDVDRGIIVSAHGSLRNIRKKPEELIGSELMVLRPSKPPTRRVLMFGPSLLSRPGYYGEVLVETARGRSRTFGVRVQLFDGSGSKRMALLRMQDVTEQVRMAQEMRRMHNELQASFIELRDSKGKLDEAKRAASLSLFAAGLAHEVNNPLSIALSSVSSLPGLVEDIFHLKNSKKQEGLQDIHDAVKDATSAMSRIADMIKRIEQLEIPITFQKFDMGTALRSRASKNVKISLQSSADLTLSSDQQALLRVVDVVLENAFFATQGKGPVSIKTSEKDESIVLCIEDFGCGMSEDVRQRACDPFFTTRPPGKGLGLGLFLAARTMARIGAELSITSKEGHGTKVTLTLPKTPDTEASNAISYEGFRTG